MKIATWNVLILSNTGYQVTLTREMTHLKVNIIGITEARIYDWSRRDVEDSTIVFSDGTTRTHSVAFPGRWFRPLEPTRTDEKWLVYRPVPDGSPVFPTASGRKSHGIMETVFRTDSIVPGNGKIRQVPFAGFYPEARGIRAGNQSEINVSLRNLAGKVRIAAGC